MFSERRQTWKTTDGMIPFSMKFPEKAKRKTSSRLVVAGKEDGIRQSKVNCKVKLR